MCNSPHEDGGDFATRDEREGMTIPRGKAAIRSRVRRERRGTTLEVLATSEKLAHRITSELGKTWRGKATYKWADDGSLFARWRPGRPE
jgi:hypothetical protein